MELDSVIARLFKRHLHSLLSEELRLSPAVALLGPRQVGKTTLALEVARDIPHVYLDLKSERDRGKLAGPKCIWKAIWTNWASWMKCTGLLACFLYCAA
jgi:predicted AAA+ superfamily ATPase